MREPVPADHPEIDLKRRSRAGRPWSPSTPFVVSIAVHALAAYALLLHPLADAPAPPHRVADYFVFELPTPRPEPAPPPTPEEAPITETAPVQRLVEERGTEGSAPAAEAPVERAVVDEPAAPASEAQPQAIAEAEPAASDEAPTEQATPETTPAPFVDFSEESRRAAREVVAERSTESEYLTFTMDDVAPPRAEPEEEPKRSIFDGGGADFGRRSVGTVGQQRTKLGRKLAELCNALTGGFGVSLLGFGLFSACASPDTGPSGLFPEVRPAYLDLMPECVDTRDTAPALALEAPFPTVKCRLVKQDPGE